MNFDEDKKSVDDSRSRDLSPGKLLVWARERANLSQEQVAKELYMTLTKVKSLEADDYRHIGTDTFARGYLRAYANLVHLDVHQVLVAYDRFLQKSGASESAAPRRAESVSTPIWQFALFILAALFILWLISIWFFNNRQQPVVARPATLAPQLTVREPLPPASSSSAAFSSVAEEGSSQPVLIEGDVVVPAPVTATSAILSLSFTAECWLEVSDAQGDVLAADLQAAGSSLQLEGKPPFDVKLGNAHAAIIKLNDEVVVLTPSPTTSVLSLKVGQ